MTNGFYNRLKIARADDNALTECIEHVVEQLETTSTTTDKPGMLLGKIQSGKTRAFIGIIAHAFDKGFDIAIVLTKGTKTLSAQTVERLRSSFEEDIREDRLMVFDIQKLPGKLVKSEQKRKLVIVSKKQADNLRHLLDFFQKDYPDLKDKRILLIDDEADLASVRFVSSKKGAEIEQGTIAAQIDNLRRLVKSIAFLQVTATPYSLYLQPEDYDETEYAFKPKKPAFTELLPIHKGYVGGDDYFTFHGKDDPRSFLFVDVPSQEQDALRKEDHDQIQQDQILTSPGVTNLVRAISTFLLAVCVRRWQQREAEEKELKYAMVIHNDIKTQAHTWQDQVIEWIFQAMATAANNSPADLNSIFNTAYIDLSASVQANGGIMPNETECLEMFLKILEDDDVVRETVNKDNNVMALLDENAELKLRTAANIFIGGNILDRGITIPNLISFYYGRNPQKMQADTVLQHSRMYGNRDRRDLAVTRFFTSKDVYDRLYTINNLENALREAFENGAHEKGVVFIQTDKASRVRPCAPSKILLSNTVTIMPNGFYLPTNFVTRIGKEMDDIQSALDALIPIQTRNSQTFTEISKEDALEIISLVEKSLVFPANDFEWNAMRALLDYYAGVMQDSNGKILMMAATDRKLHKLYSGDKSGGSIIGQQLRKIVDDPTRSKAALVLLQQEGTKDLGWSGHKFWWPVLAAPGAVEPCVFASQVATS